MMFKGVTSSRKIAKAARKAVQARLEQRFNELKDIIKPQPRWLPSFLWKRVVKMVINFKLYKDNGTENKVVEN